MDSLGKLAWTFNSKGIETKAYSNENNDAKVFIETYIKSEDAQSWAELLNRLNAVYNNCYRFCINDESLSENSKKIMNITFDVEPNDIEKAGKLIDVLNNAVAYEEYKRISHYNDGSMFDIKLGISCNNNCVHCVVKPRIFEVQRNNPEKVVLDSGLGMQCSCDLTYEQVINILSTQVDNVHGVVLTGGEPTLRKDFLQIVKWIYYNKPFIKVYIQSNGRNFSDKNLVRALRRYTRNIYVAVAIHGAEEVHNKVVNNRKDKGNPYKETIEGIKNLLEFFRSDEIRSEMVLSSHNIHDVMKSVKFQYEELCLKHIGISYPHLDGFDREYIESVAPSINDVFALMQELNNYLRDKNDLLVMIEEVPACIYSRIEGEIKIRSFGFSREKVIMNFMGDQSDQFTNYWALDHKKFAQCKGCKLNDKCVGAWKETVHLNEMFIKPVESISQNFEKFLKEHGWNFECNTCC